MEEYLYISDAAKEINLESHVLRYWEEELSLPIRRNELGHRYYTREDVERFKKIKELKERGLQLKAIKMILKNGGLEAGSPFEGANEKKESGEAECQAGEPLAIEIVKPAAAETVDPGEKAYRLQLLLKNLFLETLQENNRALGQAIKEDVLKELDYHFRQQEEREEERTRLQQERDEMYYRRIDDLIRKKSTRFPFRHRKEKITEPVK